MTAKDYLMEIQKCKRTADDLDARAEVLRTQMAGLKAITYDKDRVQVSPSNKMEELIALLVDIEERYADALIKYHHKIIVCTEQVNSLKSRLQSRLLVLRYFNDESWEQIAQDLNPGRARPYSYEYIIRLHGKALKNFSKKFKMS